MRTLNTVKNWLATLLFLLPSTALAANFSVTPNSGSVQVGSQLAVGVNLTPGASEGAWGYHLELVYNTADLSVNTLSPTATFSTTYPNTQVPGRVLVDQSFAAGACATATKLTSAATVVNISFNTLRAASTSLSIDTVNSYVIDPCGNSFPLTASGGTYTITASSTAPSITTQPTNQTVNTPTSASFAGAASGSPTPTLQWQGRTSAAGTFANISGATSGTLNVSPSANATYYVSGAQFRLVATNGVGTPATSNTATLTINTAQTAPSITTQPANRTVTTPTAASFTGAASGNPTPTLQWQGRTSSAGTLIGRAHV